MFSKEKKYEVWNKPKLFWFAGYTNIERVKLYGYQYSSKGNFYVYQKQDHMDLSSAKYIQNKKTWIHSEPKEYDQDKSFIINVMIEKKKEQIKQLINRTQKQIDDMPQTLIILKDKISNLEEMAKLVSENKFHWKLGTKASEQTPESLKIYDDVKDKSGATTVHF